MTVSELSSKMDMNELCHWMMYFKIENEKYDKSDDKKTPITRKGKTKPKANSGEKINLDQMSLREAAGLWGM